MGRFQYRPSIGPAQYRRTVYAFWRRTSTPTFLFDAATRRSCEVVQRRTNTPLHALTLLNDTTALEAARSLALNALSAVSAEEPLDRVTNGERNDRRLAWMFRRVLTRDPVEIEMSVLRQKLDVVHEHYSGHPAEADTLVQVGQCDTLPDCDRVGLAANMAVANLLLNLDEAITHE